MSGRQGAGGFKVLRIMLRKEVGTPHSRIEQG